MHVLKSEGWWITPAASSGRGRQKLMNTTEGAGSSPQMMRLSFGTIEEHGADEVDVEAVGDRDLDRHALLLGGPALLLTTFELPMIELGTVISMLSRVRIRSSAGRYRRRARAGRRRT